MAEFIAILVSLLIFSAIIVSIYYLHNQSDESGKSKKKEKPKYYKKIFSLLNDSEFSFYSKMKDRIPEGFVIFPQVNLRNIVEVNDWVNNSFSYHNKINRKIIDFVIFEEANLNPVLAIEYDGRTHQWESRRKRDAFVNDVLKQAGIPIKHVIHSSSINYEHIISLIKN